MKSRILMGLILALLFALPSFAGGDAAAGKGVYVKKCATCHGPDGEGKEAIAKLYKVKMAPLGSKEVQARSDADLQKIVAEGTGKMKPVKDVSGADVTNLVAYIRTLAKK